jgi:hypothetical protein
LAPFSTKARTKGRANAAGAAGDDHRTAFE